MPQVILFDGVCNLCNSFVQFIIKEDRQSVFRFASLQSDYAKKKLDQKSFDTSKVDSVILITEEDQVLIKSDAALAILKQLPRFSWLYFFRFLPLILRDWVYDFTARNRYRWFGKRRECMIPTPELRSLFLD
ncbi:thiol-disulfide oxidoreductase DCC family protein [Jiulongibacter sediminis]|uniref:Thiol-disulfide oxidoreductase n=1 Tax=Jiulongibacter sediminis TaxID=1605367 RepID=A0A0N8H9N1_9BACT|nr:thiol-disulfide oxidoreductase DCC family protein [Jiulongibacter sediminis]KPM47836.1 thiol-disulfide oxidoreductase [Jiulongibacter sediminis]TBX24021.1 thiol-disulfide oxidoreductase [Jiulongibacter sediminis]